MAVAPMAVADVATVSDTIDARLASVAEVTGEDAGNIQQVRMDISKLLDQGLLIDIDLHGFSMLKASTSWEELGIRSDDKRRNRISRGQKNLAPTHYVNRLQSLDTRFRQVLDKYSFKVTGFLPWRWLPLTAYTEWKKEHDELKVQLEAIKAEILAHWEEIEAENEEYFQAVARRAWKSYNTPDDESVVRTPDGKVLAGYDAFEAHIVDAALAKMPTKGEIRTGIWADYRTGFLITPPEAQALQAQAEEAYARASKAQAEAHLAWQIERERGAEISEREWTQRARLQAIREAELEHARQQLQAITNPLDEVMESFRAQIYGAVISIAQSIQKNGHLRGKVAQQARGLKDLYELLASATNDTELETALQSLQNALDKSSPDGKKYDIGAVEHELAKITEMTQDAARDVERRSEAQTRAAYLEF